MFLYTIMGVDDVFPALENEGRQVDIIKTSLDCSYTHLDDALTDTKHQLKRLHL